MNKNIFTRLNTTDREKFNPLGIEIHAFLKSMFPKNKFLDTIDAPSFVETLLTMALESMVLDPESHTTVSDEDLRNQKRVVFGVFRDFKGLKIKHPEKPKLFFQYDLNFKIHIVFTRAKHGTLVFNTFTACEISMVTIDPLIATDSAPFVERKKYFRRAVNGIEFLLVD